MIMSTLRNREAKKNGGLDRLDAFVHERRAVDRDLFPHFPGGMSQSLVNGDIG